MENFGQPNQFQPAPDPGRRPSDGGLSGLGLIMQLVGGITGAFVGGYGMLVLMMMLQAGGRGLPGSIMLFVVALIATSIWRSIAHAGAGRRLLYEGPGTPASALKRYVVASFVQTGVFALGLLANDAPGKITFGLILLLIAWPIALLFIAKPKIDEFGDAVPMADDKGFEGASILLLIFGAMGVAASAIMSIGAFDGLSGGRHGKTSIIGIALLGSVVMLLIRSIFHLRAGIRGTRANLMTETAEAAEKYANFGQVAALVTGGAIMVGMFAEMPSGAAGMMMPALFGVAMITWMLLIWPMIVKKFFSDRQFATIMESPNAQQTSSDRGLPTLGWLLLAFGVFALASGLAGVIMGDMTEGGGRHRMRGDNPMEGFLGMLGNSGGKSPWFGIGVAALQIWAGVELIRVSARYKIAGMVYGIVAAGIALYVYLPMFGGLSEGGAGMVMNPAVLMVFALAAMQLVVPIATAIFVQRKVTDPKAVAQTFE